VVALYFKDPYVSFFYAVVFVVEFACVLFTYNFDPASLGDCLYES